MTVDSLSPTAATDLANRHLLGAALDCLRSYSLEASLVFLKDDSQGGLLSITIDFICSASADDCLADDRDFFAERSRFLGSAYALLGGTVSAVEIDENGVLKVYFGAKKVVLTPSEEYVENDEAAWRIQVEQRGLDRQAIPLACVNDDGAFLCVATGSKGTEVINPHP